MADDPGQIWADARRRCEGCGGSGNLGPAGRYDGAKKRQLTSEGEVVVCGDCDGEGSVPVQVELIGLASGAVRVREWKATG